jgi:hypothetical protein
MTLAGRRPGGRRGAGGWKRMAVYFVGLEERDGRIKWNPWCSERAGREISWRKREKERERDRALVVCCYMSVHGRTERPVSH